MKRLCLIGAILLAATPLAADRAGAAVVGGSHPFGLTPRPAPDGQPRPYFQVQLSPGQAHTDDVIISNDGRTTLHLVISASSGTTAPNSGTAFQGYFRPCAGVSCWLSGLPARVTLPPGGREEAGFTIRVPVGASAQQYLAGITAQPANAPSPIALGSSGHASADVFIIDQVSVGVAITVGPASQLRTALEIPNVTAGTVGTTPRLYVQVHNTGQTFTKADGDAVCILPTRRLTLGITMDTVLPRNGATLPVNAPGLRAGSPTHCIVRLLYGYERVATWSGTVTIPAVKQPRTLHSTQGALPPQIVHPIQRALSPPPPGRGIPAWAAVLITLASLAIALSTGAIILLLRRRKNPRPTTTIE